MAGHGSNLLNEAIINILIKLSCMSSRIMGLGF